MLGYGLYESDYSESLLFANYSYWNVYYNKTWNENEISYYTVTLDCSVVYYDDEYENGYYKQIFYKNGEKIYEGRYNKLEWDYFLENDIDNLICFIVGKCTMTKSYYWHYSEMMAYMLRLYARGLTEEEILENYNTSVAYHTLLENMN